MSSFLPIVLSFYLFSPSHGPFRQAETVTRSPATLPKAPAPAADAEVAPGPVVSAEVAPAPPKPATGGPRYPWKTDIVATVFWVGELPTQNNPVPNTKSSWDTRWVSSFGGYDDPDPDKRAPGYHPAGFRPKQNPFYVALPYNDCLSSHKTKSDAAKIIPWYDEAFQKAGKSVCHNRWLAIHYKGRVCYAQWSDCGPFTTNDGAYVFGSARPSNKKNAGAGLDISPAVRDFLQLPSGGKCDWRFVDLHEIGHGPWKYYGNNNPFAPEPAAPEPDGVFTAEYTISTSRPVGKFRPAKEAAIPTKRKTTVQKPSDASRLEALRRAREEWFNRK